MQHALNHSTAHSFKGSVEYIAPEVIVAGWCREGSRYLSTSSGTAGIMTCAVCYRDSMLMPHMPCMSGTMGSLQTSGPAASSCKCFAL